MKYFTKEFYEMMTTPNSGKKINDVFFKYQEYFKSIKQLLPDEFIENFNMHDCHIINTSYKGNDFIIELDNKGGFTKISKITFINCENKNLMRIKNAWWLYSEIYIKKNNRYNLWILIDKGRNINEVSITASDIIFEYDK